MKRYYVVLFILGSFALLTCAENEDPCDVDHIIVNGECVPTYIFPEPNALQNGDKYYHEDFGIIIYKNGYWVDEWDHILEDLGINTNL